MCFAGFVCFSFSRWKHFVYLSLAPFHQNHRVSLSLLDDSAGDFFICQRSDEGFGVSLIGLGVSVNGLHVSLALLDASSTKSRMISPRLSISILDEIEDDIFSSLCLSPRRLRDESLGVSRCRSPRGSWNKPSLSLDGSPLSGPELSSTKSKAR